MKAQNSTLPAWFSTLDSVIIKNITPLPLFKSPTTNKWALSTFYLIKRYIEDLRRTSVRVERSSTHKGNELTHPLAMDIELLTLRDSYSIDEMTESLGLSVSSLSLYASVILRYPELAEEIYRRPVLLFPRETLLLETAPSFASVLVRGKGDDLITIAEISKKPEFEFTHLVIGMNFLEVAIDNTKPKDKLHPEYKPLMWAYSVQLAELEIIDVPLEQELCLFPGFHTL